jgi:hypothetical protein
MVARRMLAVFSGRCLNLPCRNTRQGQSRSRRGGGRAHRRARLCGRWGKSRSFDDEGQPYKLRIRTGAVLGLGACTLEIPIGAFMALRGAVVLDLPAEAVTTLLPEFMEREVEK